MKTIDNETYFSTRWRRSLTERRDINKLPFGRYFRIELRTPIASVPVSSSRRGNAWQNVLNRRSIDDWVSQRIGQLEIGPRRSLLPRFLDARAGKAIDSTCSSRVANFANARASRLGMHDGSPSSAAKSVRN